jgi:hypothetical protein
MSRSIRENQRIQILEKQIRERDEIILAQARQITELQNEIEVQKWTGKAKKKKAENGG